MLYFSVQFYGKHFDEGFDISTILSLALFVLGLIFFVLFLYTKDPKCWAFVCEIVGLLSMMSAVVLFNVVAAQHGKSIVDV